MPQSPLRYCSAPGCSSRVTAGYCPSHQPKREHGVHYGRRWGKVRLEYLAEHPFCVDCERLGQQTLATEVDHIIPHNGRARLFWDRSNYQALCKSHHSQKTQREQTGA
jgi:5-methylcytosine-specific restriction enzyme A